MVLAEDAGSALEEAMTAAGYESFEAYCQSRHDYEPGDEDQMWEIAVLAVDERDAADVAGEVAAYADHDTAEIIAQDGQYRLVVGGVVAATLEHDGWSEDGIEDAGYDPALYFGTDDGRYLGPDEDGVYPTWREAVDAPTPDVVVRSEGSLVVLWPATPSGTAFLADHAPDEAQWWGHSLVVEPRYAQRWIEGMQEEGLTVVGYGDARDRELGVAG